MDEATAKRMANKGVWLSIQPFLGEVQIPTTSPPPSIAGTKCSIH
jgi:hypothetical protein